jgi:hypothetical protein
MDDMEELEDFMKSSDRSFIRATCLYCGAKFRSLDELGPHVCKPRFWFWLVNHHPLVVVFGALLVGYLIGILLGPL